MTQEINQLERAKLADKHGLRVQFRVCTNSRYYLTTVPQWNSERTYRVNPDDEAKLEAIIWEGADSGNKYAYVDDDGILVLGGRLSLPEWKLIATRELPAESIADRLVAEKTEEAQLFADLKEFVKFAADPDTQDHWRFHEAKKLLERINPKPVCECCGQLLEKKDD